VNNSQSVNIASKQNTPVLPGVFLLSNQIVTKVHLLSATEEPAKLQAPQGSRGGFS